MDKLITTRERFLIGFISSLFLPFAKLYQNGSLLVSDESVRQYLLGIGGPFLVLGLLMGLYAWLVEKDETNNKRLFRTCFALPGVLLSLLGTNGSTTSTSTAKADSYSHEIVCEQKIEVIQGLIDAFDALTNNHRHRYYLLSKNPKDLHKYHEHVEYQGLDYSVKAKMAKKPIGPGFYFDVRDCKTFEITTPFKN